MCVCVCVCESVFICRHPLVHDSRDTVSLLGERERERERFWNALAYLCLLFPRSVSVLPFVRLFLCLSLSESTIPELDTISQNILKTLSQFVPNVSQFLPVSKTVWAELGEQLLSFSAQNPPSYSLSTKAVIRAWDTFEPGSQCKYCATVF